MDKLFCHLLFKVKHVIIANFYIAKMSFNAIRENFRIYSICLFSCVSHDTIGAMGLSGICVCGITAYSLFCFVNQLIIISPEAHVNVNTLGDIGMCG